MRQTTNQKKLKRKNIENVLSIGNFKELRHIKGSIESHELSCKHTKESLEKDLNFHLCLILRLHKKDVKAKKVL